MEGFVETMLFLLGLGIILNPELKDKEMGKRGKRGKRNKWQQEVDDQLTVKELINSRKKEKEKNKKPFENIKLPPPREAQRKPE